MDKILKEQMEEVCGEIPDNKKNVVNELKKKMTELNCLLMLSRIPIVPEYRLVDMDYNKTYKKGLDTMLNMAFLSFFIKFLYEILGLSSNRIRLVVA